MAKNPRDMREAGMPPRDVKVIVAGQDYNGHYYQLGQPPRIEVCSAYGSASQALGRGDPKTVAKRLMAQIVTARASG